MLKEHLAIVHGKLNSVEYARAVCVAGIMPMIELRRIRETPVH